VPETLAVGVDTSWAVSEENDLAPGPPKNNQINYFICHVYLFVI
jgi:hypothetical protein